MGHPDCLCSEAATGRPADLPAALAQSVEVEEVLRHRFPVARIQQWPLGECPLLLCRLAEDARCAGPGPGRLLLPADHGDLTAACRQLRSAVEELCRQPAAPSTRVAKAPDKKEASDRAQGGPGRTGWSLVGQSRDVDVSSGRWQQQKETAVCPKGHALRELLAPRDDFFCDMCGADVPRGAILYGCRRCDWDACWPCAGRAPACERPVATPTPRGARRVEVHAPVVSAACEGGRQGSPRAAAAPQSAAAPLLPYRRPVGDAAPELRSFCAAGYEAGWSLERQEAADRASSSWTVSSARRRQFAMSIQPAAWLGWVEGVAHLDESDEAGRERLTQAAHASVLRGWRSGPELQPALWLWLASDGGQRSKMHPGKYVELCHKAPEDEEAREAERVAVDQIKRDLDRTSPELYAGADHDLGCGTTHLSVPAFERVQALQRLLLAFSRHRPSIGYCQGLNFIAAALLRVMDEASAFAVFCGLVARLPQDLYSQDPDRLHACRSEMQEKVRTALAQELPELAQHLEELSVDVNFFLPKWLSVLFASVLPVPAVHRLWDFVLGPGGGASPLCLALALLQRAEVHLLEATDLGEALHVLSEVVNEVSEGDVEAMLLTEWPIRRFESALRRSVDVGDSASDKSDGPTNRSTIAGSSFASRSMDL